MPMNYSFCTLIHALRTTSKQPPHRNQKLIRDKMKTPKLEKQIAESEQKGTFAYMGRKRHTSTPIFVQFSTKRSRADQSKQFKWLQFMHSHNIHFIFKL